MNSIENLVVNRRVVNGEDRSEITVNGELYSDTNILKLIEQVEEKYTEYKDQTVYIQSDNDDPRVSTVWGFPHQGYDVVHVDLTQTGYIYGEVLLDDIHEEMSVSDVDRVMMNVVRYWHTANEEEAIECGINIAKRDYKILVTR